MQWRVQFFQRQPDGPAPAIAALMGSLVAAGAKRLVARAGEHDHPDRPVPSGLVECVDQFVAGAGAKCVVSIRPVNGNSCNAFMNPQNNVGIVFHTHLLGNADKSFASMLRSGGWWGGGSPTMRQFS
jgi:hypothetical protein